MLCFWDGVLVVEDGDMSWLMFISFGLKIGSVILKMYGMVGR